MLGRISLFIRVGVLGLWVALGTAQAQPSPPLGPTEGEAGPAPPGAPAPSPVPAPPVPGATPAPAPSATPEPAPAPPPTGAEAPTAAPAAAGVEPSSGATLADPYGISQAKPIPQPVGGNPYRGPDASPPPSRRELPVLSQSCAPGAECFEADPRLNDRFRAVRGSPFVQLLSGGFHFRERVSTSVAFGAEIGAFLFDRLRASMRALVPAADVNDEISADAESRDGSPWLWGITLGAAADRQPGFVLSPSLQYMAILGDDFGHSIGILIPFEWLSQSGVRVGFDFSLLYGFGGTYVSPTQGAQDRPNSAGVSMNFLLGYTFGLEGD